MAKIYSPNKEYTGISAGVPFVNGTGETSDPHIIEWFENHGYEVEEPEESDQPLDPPKEPEVPEKLEEPEPEPASTKKTSKKKDGE